MSQLTPRFMNAEQLRCYDSSVQEEIKVARNYITLYQAACMDRAPRAERAALNFLESSLSSLKEKNWSALPGRTRNEVTGAIGDIERILKRY